MYLHPIKKGKWSFYAVSDDRDSCPLLDEFKSIARDNSSDIEKLLGIIERISGNPQGPQLLPKETSHLINDQPKIYQFRAGRVRLLWFYSTSFRKLIICDCIFIKKTRRTPRKYIRKIAQIQSRYETLRSKCRVVIID